MEGQFLERIVKFLKEVDWLYDFPVTQVFTRNVLTKIPEDWQTVFKKISLDGLNGIPECRSEAHWPTSLKDFLGNCQSLSLKQWMDIDHHDFTVDSSQDLQMPQELYRGMSPKKKHEVLSVIQYVKKLSQITNSSHVLDIGSGMGYVDLALHHLLKLTVLGAESKESIIEGAQARKEKFTGTCHGVQNMKWYLQDNQATLSKAKEIVSELKSCNVMCTCNHNHQSTQDIETINTDVKFIENSMKNDEQNKFLNSDDEFSTNGSVMLMGLHSCADLSPVMMKIFQHCPEISTLMLFSCCYHKLEKLDLHNCEGVCTGDNMKNFSPEEEIEYTKDNLEFCKRTTGITNIGKVSYRNFPMSDTVKRVMTENNFHLSIYGLRLAAQESGIRWLKHSEEDHESHKRNVAYRALLEVLCQRENLILKKCRRRCARKSKFGTFQDYVTAVTENYEFYPFTRGESDSEANNDSAGVNAESISGDSFLEKTSQTQNPDLSQPLDEENQISHVHIRDNLMKFYTDFEDVFCLIEPLTGLQLALQPVLEALVLIDRLAYLKENNFSKVWLQEVFDVALSPRNIALIAVR